MREGEQAAPCGRACLYTSLGTRHIRVAPIDICMARTQAALALCNVMPPCRPQRATTAPPPPPLAMHWEEEGWPPEREPLLSHCLSATLVPLDTLAMMNPHPKPACPTRPPATRRLPVAAEPLSALRSLCVPKTLPRCLAVDALGGGGRGGRVRGGVVDTGKREGGVGGGSGGHRLPCSTGGRGGGLRRGVGQLITLQGQRPTL